MPQTPVNKSSDSPLNGQSYNLSGKNANLGESVEKFSHDLGKHVGDMASEASDKVSGYMTSTRGYVQTNPIQSVAIAAGAGLVLGSLITLMARRS